MEKEERNQRACKPQPLPETDLFLRWGNRKRLRCVRIRDPQHSNPASIGGRTRRKITSRFVTVSDKDGSYLQPATRITRNSEMAATLRSDNRRSSSASPEKEDRTYTTRGSVLGLDENGKASKQAADGGVGGGDGGAVGDDSSSNRKPVWPKLYITLSTKEKEEDFMAMKGCKPPQRPKKRAKVIQRTLLLVSPGAWLTDMCQERYEVREKKCSKKRPRGLKAMGSMESDSD